MTKRLAQADELLTDAEALVRARERDLEAAVGYLERDVAETLLREALRIQDEACAAVAPVIEAAVARRRLEVER